MFNKTAPVTESATGKELPVTEVIPLSVLQLELEPPGVGGWDAFLTVRNIEVLVDDIGRASISRADARRLLDEQRENEARQREVLERQERQAIEAAKGKYAYRYSGRHGSFRHDWRRGDAACRRGAAAEECPRATAREGARPPLGA